jgi:hypothetical protein
MFAPFVQMTTATGGTGALTLASLSGWPTYASAFGSSGTRFVAYSVSEYTNSSLNVLSKYESGIGTIDLATLILTRTDIAVTWDGTTYDTSTPAAVSFGTTAANVLVTCDPGAGLVPDVAPWVVTSVGDGLGLIPASNVTASTQALTANVETYVPFWYAGNPDIAQIGVSVTTAVASTHVKAGLFDMGQDGLPNTRFYDLNSASPWDTSTTGSKTVSGTFYIPPGWYYFGLIADGAPTLRAAAHVRTGHGGTLSGVPPGWLAVATGSYTTGLPATRSSSIASTAGNGPLVWLKAA